MGNRFSSLPTAEYCGMSAKLNLGSGRSAVQSQYFHALCAGDTETAGRLVTMLTPEEVEETEKWHKPELPDIGRFLSFNQEHGLALDEWGAAVPKGSGQAFVEGTADLAVLYETREYGHRIAFIGDLKRSHFTASPDSLQLYGYAVAWAAETDATHIQTGIFSLTEGYWRLGRAVSTDSDEYRIIRERVLNAAANTEEEYRMGQHCMQCYARFRCPAWGLGPSEAPTALAQEMAKGLTNDNAAKLLELTKRAEDLAEQAKEHLKAYVAKHGPIVWGDKQWGPVEVKGRAGFDTKRLERERPELAREYAKVGRPSKQYRWTKV